MIRQIVPTNIRGIPIKHKKNNFGVPNFDAATKKSIIPVRVQIIPRGRKINPKIRNTLFNFEYLF